MKLTTKEGIKFAESVISRLAVLQNAEKDPHVSYTFSVSFKYPQNIQIGKCVFENEYESKIKHYEIRNVYTDLSNSEEKTDELLTALHNWELDVLPEEKEDKPDEE